MKKITLLFAFMLATITWQTNAQVTSFPWNEDFENAGAIPTGWTQEQVSGTVDYTFENGGHSSHPAAAHGGSYNALFYSGNHDGNDTKLISPELDLTGLTNPVLSFWHTQAKWVNDQDELRVYYKTSASGSWTLIPGQEYTSSITDWTQEVLIALPNPSATYYIAFDALASWGYGVAIDDVEVAEAPSVYNPAFNVDTTPDCANGQFNVNVNITDLGGATSVTVSDDQGSTTQQATAMGTVVMGPYTSGTSVNITVTNDQDNTYTDSHDTSYYCPPANDDMSGAIPITPSPAGSGCSTYTFQAWGAHTGVTDSGMDGSCNGTDTGLDVFYSWTATTNALMWNDGDGNPGIIIRDTSGNEITCRGTFAPDDYILSGWGVGQDLIIQIYDYEGSDADVSFCLEEYTIPEPSFTTTINADCANAQFSVDVNVVDFGTATSVTVSDDQGSTAQALAAPGTLSFGPYAEGTSVVFTVTNDQDNTITSTKTVEYYCPPANNECADAQALTINDPAVSGTTFGSSDLPDICGTGTLGDGVWYSFTGNGNEVIVQVDNVAGGLDGELQIFTGTCGSEVCVDRADSHGSDAGESITFTTTNGEAYLVVFGAYANTYRGHGTFDIVVNETNAIADNQIAGFKFYPNPVNHTLNLSAQGQIENVNIYNITGQEVINIQPNAVQTQVDMSQLQNGIYFIKAQVNGQVTAFKVVKK